MCGEQEHQLFDFFDKVLKDHEKFAKEEQQEVFKYALSSYTAHLQDLEKRDINALKRKLAEMKKAKKDLEEVLAQENDIDGELDRIREHAQFEVDEQIVLKRQEVEAYQ